VGDLHSESEPVAEQSTGQVLTILLTKGFVALIDSADYELVSQYKWRHCKGCARSSDDVLMHRLLLDAPDGIEVDHVNHDTLDNRRCNMRLASRTENARNRRVQKNNVLGLKGVELRPGGSYRATIFVNGQRLRFGPFATDIEAALAFDAAARLHFGAFANTNFPLDTDTQSLAAE
jgi:hypothetical protein